MTALSPKKVVLASGNAGKVREIQAVLAACDIEVLPQSQFDVPEAVEDGLTFVENALIKARHAAKITGLPAIADDSGIEVDFLNGQPGIYSSRYASESNHNPEKPIDQNQANNAKLLAALKGVKKEQRTARFQCVIVYLKHELDPTPIICQAAWEGYITEETSGAQGFGYDPVFFVAGQNCTSAELAPELKNQISHRGQALSAFVDAFSRSN